MIIKAEQLKSIMPNVEANISRNAFYDGVTLVKLVETLNKYTEESEIRTKLQWVHLLANIAVETGEFRYTAENLNYSADRLLAVFPKYFNRKNVSIYANNPRKIANRVYANRYGNGDEASGDGYAYRGRGCFQFTFKNNYQEYAKWCGYDVVARPDLLACLTGSVRSACHYFKSRGCCILAQQDKGAEVRRRINGGLNGWDAAQKYIERGKKVL